MIVYVIKGKMMGDGNGRATPFTVVGPEFMDWLIEVKKGCRWIKIEEIEIIER